ncbi:uncharacterized protein LOC131928389 [Physella acuta]|uniref:uncharacterized protein LOC131928389 n=1 Tax=Physella acuta TaxID=109671 RepID=UPI0027DCB765|nr:uncharacterized protein LOC131928389 [Physella acuta]
MNTARCCERPLCENVLRDMLDGRWEKKAHSQQELEEINKFLHISRSHHFLPYSLQREDKRCGNVSFDELEGRMNDLQWFRAVCDPDGDTPCCHNNQCVYLPEDECRCEGCYDMRQQIHAELATWRPSDLRCQMALFTNPADTCKALHNMTLYLIGDSLIRHVYIALLGLLRAHKPYGPLRPYTAPGLVEMCDRNFVHLQMCMNYIDRDTWECDHQLKLKFLEYVKADQWELTLKAIDELRGKINSWVLIGIGIHDNFDTPNIVNKLLVPLLKQASQSTWPRIVWSATHAPGLLKIKHPESSPKAQRVY